MVGLLGEFGSAFPRERVRREKGTFIFRRVHMPDRPDGVKTPYGPCHKCGESIEEPDKPVKYRGNIYHEAHVPKKSEEKATDKSYT
jgi:hypothetical protein